ncbi:FAD-dependent oxidoreductase [Halorientalis marina]|jgi:thioredoxin reductase|uniref:FAD-dependent oxidoreductase n=1 Tax=Halorientalis marina TaxID=2931976 RepID=UPI001FF18A26|nr:FAD-dependent oxidoreductase [Halorientalis marina]
MTETRDVVIVGGGVAGLTAGVFTARHGLETTVLDSGESILRRNAHLENVPGFPAGVNARLYLDMLGDQAERAGCERELAEVTSVAADDEGFVVETAAGADFWADYVIAATKNTVDYLRGIEGVGFVDRGKTFVDCNEYGETGVDGLYVAGRLAEKAYQTVVCAGHGAEVATRLLDEDERPFYHDWTVPEDYFTGRGRDVPPGCEEIDAAERRRREAESVELMQEYFAEPYGEEPVQHPSVAGDD